LESFAAGKGRPTSRWPRGGKAIASAGSGRGASAEASRGSTGMKGIPRQAGPSQWGRRGASSGRGATGSPTSRSARRACGDSAGRWWPASQSPQLASAPPPPRSTTANAPKTIMAATMRGLAANRDGRLGRWQRMGQKPWIRLGPPAPWPPHRTPSSPSFKNSRTVDRPTGCVNESAAGRQIHQIHLAAWCRGVSFPSLSASQTVFACGSAMRTFPARIARPTGPFNGSPVIHLEAVPSAATFQTARA